MPCTLSIPRNVISLLGRRESREERESCPPTRHSSIRNQLKSEIERIYSLPRYPSVFTVNVRAASARLGVGTPGATSAASPRPCGVPRRLINFLQRGFSRFVYLIGETWRGMVLRFFAHLPARVSPRDGLVAEIHAVISILVISIGGDTTDFELVDDSCETRMFDRAIVIVKNNAVVSRRSFCSAANLAHVF